MPPDIVMLNPERLVDIYKLYKKEDILSASLDMWQFVTMMVARPGWMFVVEGEIVAVVVFSDFFGTIDATIHSTCRSDYRGRWITRTALRTIFNVYFNVWNMQRCSGFSIPNISDEGGNALMKIGFKQEGIKRKSIALYDGSIHDVVYYGMLRDECRWIKRKEE